MADKGPEERVDRIGRCEKELLKLSRWRWRHFPLEAYGGVAFIDALSMALQQRLKPAQQRSFGAGMLARG